MTKFEMGDIVRLKSDGVKMTVESYDDLSGIVQCVWHDGQNLLQKKGFDPLVLDKVSTNDISEIVRDYRKSRALIADALKEAYRTQFEYNPYSDDRG